MASPRVDESSEELYDSPEPISDYESISSSPSSTTMTPKLFAAGNPEGIRDGLVYPFFALSPPGNRSASPLPSIADDSWEVLSSSETESKIIKRSPSPTPQYDTETKTSTSPQNSKIKYDHVVAFDQDSLSAYRTSLDTSTARDHALYHTKPHSDGFFHCPWEGKGECQHKPEKLKCNYEYAPSEYPTHPPDYETKTCTSKFVDSHLKPYRCKVSACENLHFSSTACLLRHEREAHAMHGHGERPFLCTYHNCDRSIAGNGFPRHWNLRDHMKRVHNDLGPIKSTHTEATEIAPKLLSRKRKIPEVSLIYPRLFDPVLTSNDDIAIFIMSKRGFESARSATDFKTLISESVRGDIPSKDKIRKISQNGIQAKAWDLVQSCQDMMKGIENSDDGPSNDLSTTETTRQKLPTTSQIKVEPLMEPCGSSNSQFKATEKVKSGVEIFVSRSVMEYLDAKPESSEETVQLRSDVKEEPEEKIKQEMKVKEETSGNENLSQSQRARPHQRWNDGAGCLYYQWW